MLPIIKTSIPGPKSREALKELRQVENPHITYGDKDFPIFIEKSFDSLVEDVDGNTLIDTTSFFAVSFFGHQHPRLKNAMSKSLDRGWHAMGDVYPHRLKLQAAKDLCDFLPKGLGQVHFSCNGSDAVETALKTAYLKTQKRGVIAFEGAYHGLGYGAMQVTHRNYFRQPFSKQARLPVSFHPFITNESADIVVNKALQKINRDLETKEIGALIIETIQGRGGIRVAHPKFIQGLRKLCTRHGVALIIDEIYTGFFRAGLAFDYLNYKITPDLLCLGKAMGGGYPISACVGRKEWMKVWGESFGEAKHTSTFLGNPLGCALVIESLRLFQTKSVQRRAQSLSKHLEKSLFALKTEFPEYIHSVKGRGLMWGLEFRDRGIGSAICKTMLKQGVIILACGQFAEVLSFSPAISLNKKQLDYVLLALRRCLQAAKTP
ncbi:MAG: 4-aminobutyrate aminotransferase-like enzyme [Candidatus Omnitrophota bacterium]|jgi:4-aminobutyrate aminotransferase-like enzyme